MTEDNIKLILKAYGFNNSFIEAFIKNYTNAIDKNIPFPFYFSFVRTKI